MTADNWEIWFVFGENYSSYIKKTLYFKTEQLIPMLIPLPAISIIAKSDIINDTISIRAQSKTL